MKRVFSLILVVMMVAVMMTACGSSAFTVDFDTLGITVDGTPVSGDKVVVAYHRSDMNVFNAGERIPAPDLNYNFDMLRTQSNTCVIR
mgnify:CR=1 FL=1